MNCPKCKEGEVKEQVSIKGFIFKKKEVYMYCPLCDWENKKEFKLSKEDLTREEMNAETERIVEIERAKNNKETKYTQKYTTNVN